MSAQPIDYRDPRDPAVILETLPERARGVFLEEYQATAARAARDVNGYRALQELLHNWAGRAVAYSCPGFFEDRQAAAQPSADDVSLAELDAERRAR
jgi:hypothetical protein